MNEMKWIPVKEKIPEEYGEYIVTRILRKTVIVSTLIFDASSVNMFPNFIKEAFERYSVIAWMPMPEAYKED